MMRSGRHIGRNRQWSILALVSLGLVVLLGACGSLDQGPGDVDGQLSGERELQAEPDLTTPGTHASGRKGFYPLDIGNHWTYLGETVVVIDGDTSSVIHTREERSIIGTEERFGRLYILEEREAVDEDGNILTTFWVRYRQDRAGLYEADIPITEPPLAGTGEPSDDRPHAAAPRDRMANIWPDAVARIAPEKEDAYREGWENLCRRLRIINIALGRETAATPVLGGPPGGVLPEEITRLQYPLHPSQAWIIRDDEILVSAVVEEHDVLDLAPGKMGGFKIRLLNDDLGPEDLVHVWYGRTGMLGLSVYIEQELVDPGGNPIGTLVFDERRFLESLDLVRNGRW
jgi:hypothetical protein